MVCDETPCYFSFLRLRKKKQNQHRYYTQIQMFQHIAYPMTLCLGTKYIDCLFASTFLVIVLTSSPSSCAPVGSYTSADSNRNSNNHFVTINGVDAFCDATHSRVLIQRYDTESCRGGSSRYWWSQRLSGADGCGYLDEPSVRAVAQHGTGMRLETVTVTRRSGSGAMEETREWIESTTEAAVLALREGRDWHDEAVIQGWRNDFGWCFDVHPVCRLMNRNHSASRWPDMYHSCGYIGCFNWIALNGDRKELRNNGPNSNISVNKKNEAGVIAPTADPEYWYNPWGHVHSKFGSMGNIDMLGVQQSETWIVVPSALCGYATAAAAEAGSVTAASSDTVGKDDEDATNTKTCEDDVPLSQGVHHNAVGATKVFSISLIGTPPSLCVLQRGVDEVVRVRDNKQLEGPPSLRIFNVSTRLGFSRNTPAGDREQLTHTPTPAAAAAGSNGGVWSAADGGGALGGLWYNQTQIFFDFQGGNAEQYGRAMHVAMTQLTLLLPASDHSKQHQQYDDGDITPLPSAESHRSGGKRELLAAIRGGKQGGNSEADGTIADDEVGKGEDPSLGTPPRLSSSPTMGAVAFVIAGVLLIIPVSFMMVGRRMRGTGRHYYEDQNKWRYDPYGTDVTTSPPLHSDGEQQTRLSPNYSSNIHSINLVFGQQQQPHQQQTLHLLRDSVGRFVQSMVDTTNGKNSGPMQHRQHQQQNQRQHQEQHPQHGVMDGVYPFRSDTVSLTGSVHSDGGSRASPNSEAKASFAASNTSTCLYATGLTSSMPTSGVSPSRNAMFPSGLVSAPSPVSDERAITSGSPAGLTPSDRADVTTLYMFARRKMNLPVTVKHRSKRITRALTEDAAAGGHHRELFYSLSDVARKKLYHLICKDLETVSDEWVPQC